MQTRDQNLVFVAKCSVYNRCSAVNDLIP